MKKIKIIAPILTVSALAGTTVPLVSCSNSITVTLDSSLQETLRIDIQGQPTKGKDLSFIVSIIDTVDHLCFEKNGCYIQIGKKPSRFVNFIDASTGPRKNGMIELSGEEVTGNVVIASASLHKYFDFQLAKAEWQSDAGNYGMEGQDFAGILIANTGWAFKSPSSAKPIVSINGSEEITQNVVFDTIEEFSTELGFYISGTYLEETTLLQIGPNECLNQYWNISLQNVLYEGARLEKDKIWKDPSSYVIKVIPGDGGLPTSKGSVIVYANSLIQPIPSDKYSWDPTGDGSYNLTIDAAIVDTDIGILLTM